MEVSNLKMVEDKRAWRSFIEEAKHYNLKLCSLKMMMIYFYEYN